VGEGYVGFADKEIKLVNRRARGGRPQKARRRLSRPATAKERPKRCRWRFEAVG